MMLAPDVRVGQIWRDCDKRAPVVRYLIVERVDGRVYCRRCDENGRIISHGTSTSISIDRMYPHSTGYELVRDVPAEESK